MEFPMNKKLLSAAIVASLSIGLTACHDDDDPAPAEPVTTVETPDVIEVAATTVSVLVKNADTGIPVSSTATVTQLTETESLAEGESETEQTTAGLASFDFASGFDPAEGIRVSYKVEGDSFVTTSQSVVVSETGTTTLEISVVNKTTASQATGVAVTVADPVAASDTGELAEEIAAEATTSVQVDGETVDVSSSIEVPAGLTVTSDDGQAVSGQLVTTITHYEATQSESLDAFPGGLTVAIANPTVLVEETAGADTTQQLQEGDEGELTFISAGFTSVEITNENGEEVANFEPPVGALNQDGTIADADLLPTVTTEIPDTTQDPDTGLTLVPTADVPAGTTQTLRIWSFDVDTGEWTYEPESSRLAVITDNDTTDGLFEVTYPVTHLSYWNLDYFRGRNSNCTAELTVNASTGGAYAVPALLDIRAVNSGWAHGARYAGDGNLTLFNAPKDVEVEITFTDPSTGTVLTTSPATVADLCVDNGITIEVTPLEDVTTTSRQITYQAQQVCSNAAAVEAAGLTVPDPVPVPGSGAWFALIEPQFTPLNPDTRTDENGQIVFDTLVDTVSVTANGQTTTTETEYFFYIWDWTTFQWSFERGTLTELAGDDDIIEGEFGVTCPLTTGASSGAGSL